MINSVEEYLSILKKELSGCNPDIIQAALSDSEEHLREALDSAYKKMHDRSESDILQEIIENYGTPEEIAATYKEIEARKAAVSEKKKRIIPVGLVVFFSSLFTSVYFLGQGIILLNWQRFNGDGFNGLERKPVFLIWVILCFVMSIAIAIFARYVWISYRKIEKDLPIQIWLTPVTPFLLQGIALFCYWATQPAGHNRFESGTALLIGILSSSLALILLLTWIAFDKRITPSKVIKLVRKLVSKNKKLLIISGIALIAVGISISLIIVFWPARCSTLKGPVSEQWIVHHNRSEDCHDYAYDMAVDDAGNVYITGMSGRSGGDPGDYITAKYNSNGEHLWSTYYGGPASSSDSSNAIAVDELGNVYVTGGSTVYGDMGYGPFDCDSVTIKYDSNGNQLWTASYSSPDMGYDETSAITVDDSGNVYVTGVGKGGGESAAYITIKYNSDGNELWVASYTGPVSDYNTAQDIAVDSDGNVYVTGYSKGSDVKYDNDYATIKYDSNGKELWVARYNGPSSGYDGAKAIAIDESGNVYVTGESEGNGTDEDYATIKYDNNGNQLWIARYNGSASLSDSAEDIVIDSLGNIYITGHSYISYSNDNDDYTTIKYDSEGNELWVTQYNGPASGLDRAYAIALDQSVNVYVTGESHYSGEVDDTDIDSTTVCYDSNGNELWIARYNGPASNHDKTNAIAVNEEGNTFVAGYCDGGDSDFDCLVIKYTSVAE